MSFTGKRALCAALLGTAAMAGVQSAAAEEAATLKVCASKIEAPYSTAKGDGLENRIAKAVATAMGREVEFVWFDKAAIYLVRDGLDKELCDVVFGVDAQDERVKATKPYFRSGYVFVTQQDGPDFGSDWRKLKESDASRFAVRYSSPGEIILKETGKYEDNVSYSLSLVNFQDKRNKYTQVDADKLVNEVVNGDAQAAIAFGPDVARYVKAASKPLKMTVIDDDFKYGEQSVPLHYDQAMGVRKDDEALAASLDKALEKARPEIDRIVAEEGVPTLKPNG